MKLTLQYIGICVFIVLFTTFSRAEAQPSASSHAGLNSICLNFVYDKNNKRMDAELDPLDTVVNKDKLFLIGERHGVSTNPKLCAKMLRYLYVQSSVRYLIVEFGSSEAFLINRFLRTRDSSLLDPLFYSQYKDYKEFWHELYQLYVKIDKISDKIEVVGIDFEYGPSLIKALNVMMPKYKSIPPEIHSTISKIKSLSNKEYKELQDPKAFNTRKFIYWLRNEVKGKELLYRDFFGVNYRHFEQILANNVFWDSDELREMEMVNNLMRAYKNQPRPGGYFGMMGLNHTDLKNQSSFAAQMNNEASSPFANEVWVMNTHYQNCAYHYNNLLTTTKKEFLNNVLKPQEMRDFISRIELETDPCDVRLIILNPKDKIQKKLAAHGRCLLFVEGQPALQFAQKPVLILNQNQLKE